MRRGRQQPSRNHSHADKHREHPVQRWGGQKPIITGPLGAAKDRNTMADKLAVKSKRAA